MFLTYNVKHAFILKKKIAAADETTDDDAKRLKEKARNIKKIVRARSLLNLIGVCVYMCVNKIIQCFIVYVYFQHTYDEYLLMYTRIYRKKKQHIQAHAFEIKTIRFMCAVHAKHCSRWKCVRRVHGPWNYIVHIRAYDAHLETISMRYYTSI